MFYHMVIPLSNGMVLKLKTLCIFKDLNTQEWRQKEEMFYFYLELKCLWLQNNLIELWHITVNDDILVKLFATHLKLLNSLVNLKYIRANKE